MSLLRFRFRVLLWVLPQRHHPTRDFLGQLLSLLGQSALIGSRQNVANLAYRVALIRVDFVASPALSLVVGSAVNQVPNLHNQERQEQVRIDHLGVRSTAHRVRIACRLMRYMQDKLCPLSPHAFDSL